MRMRFRGAATMLLVALPGLSHGLGLGDIQLRSALNAPLSAEIELLGATAEEIAGLQVQMASRELFSRYGLDYPGFISNIQLRTGRSADGRDVILLSSSAPMTEPFATLLVEANVARQRIVREYTVLFDPPVFAPAQQDGATSAAVAAPLAGTGQRSATVSRDTAAATPAPTTVPAQASAALPSAAADTYTVQRGDSLSLVARRVSDGSDQALLAIYDANPAAFDGSINQLRAGAVLRIPDAAAIAAVDAGEARREVRRQLAAWRAGQADTASAADPRLRLVPPGGSSAAQSGAGSAEVAQLRDRVAQLEADLADSRRLLELRNAELARLQSGGAVEAAVAEPDLADADAGQVVADDEAIEAPAAPPEAQPAPAPEAAPVPAPAAAAEPGLIDRIKSVWYLPVALLVLLLGWLGLRTVRRRREDDLAVGLAPAWSDGPGDGPARPGSDTLPLNRPLSDAEAQGFLVEESGAHAQADLADHAFGQSIQVDDTAATGSLPALDATASLEQGDPLAEADFHMAYGLYDQAASLVQLAIKREPARRDLRMKLLEVFFVWGDREQFMQVARELADEHELAGPGEWEKVVIMGKQLAPDEPLFSREGGASPMDSVDLNLEGGQNHVDFDPRGDAGVLTGDVGVDLDLDSVLGEGEGGDSAAGLDFVLDDADPASEPEMTATTRQMVQPGFGDEVMADGSGGEASTVEQPRLDDAEALREQLQSRLQSSTTDETAELALDDLGLDLGKLDATGTDLLDDSQLVRALEQEMGADDDAPTMLSSLDDTASRLDTLADEANEPTELLPLGDAVEQGLDLLLPEGEATQATQVLSFDDVPGDAADDAGATSRLASLDLGISLEETGTNEALVLTDAGIDAEPAAGEVDFPLEPTVQQAQPDLSPPSEPSVGSPAPLADLEPATMSEVGTKLDLARAYMDMGDPEGARSILGEVLQEGSMSQRQEAQRLIDSIPG